TCIWRTGCIEPCGRRSSSARCCTHACSNSADGPSGTPPRGPVWPFRVGLHQDCTQSDDHPVGIAARAHYAALMSMLTPPGMGGQYRITGDRYPRMRRPRRRGRLVALTVVSVAVLGVGGWGTLQLIDVFTGGGDSASA